MTGVCNRHQRQNCGLCEAVASEHPAQSLAPFQKISEQRKRLDDCLASITGFTEESKLVRQYLIGQIEALYFAMRLFDV